MFRQFLQFLLFCTAIFFVVNGEAKIEVLVLPKPVMTQSLSLNQAIHQRRSVRVFQKDKLLTLSQVSQLMWAGQGITDVQHGYRGTPSAGALYPIELYCLNQSGIWHYVPTAHKLVMVHQGDARHSLAEAALSQSAVADAPFDIVITGIYDRVTKKYGERGVRYTHIEAGHVAQNILLEAVSLGLAAVPVGAFHDRKVRQLLQLDSDTTPLYIIPVGYKD